MVLKDEKGFIVSKKLFFILIPLLLILIAGGLFGFLKFSSKNTYEAKDKNISKKEKKEKQSKKKEMYPIIPLQTFIVNLAGGSGTRYLKLDIQLEIDNEKTQNEVTIKNPIIRDSLLILLSSKKFSDINTAKGKITLRKEITNRINGVLADGRVLQTYFSEFVVQ